MHKQTEKVVDYARKISIDIIYVYIYIYIYIYIYECVQWCVSLCREILYIV